MQKTRKKPHERTARPAGDRRMTKSLSLAAKRLQDVMVRMTLIESEAAAMALLVPEAWEELDFDMPAQAKKVRITLLLDEPVARFYRARGRGYQAYINEVLTLYAQLRIAKVIEGRDDRGIDGDPV